MTRACLCLTSSLLAAWAFLMFPAKPEPCSAAPAPGRRSPPKSLTNSVGMKLTLIPAGTFRRGSPDDESDRFDEEGPQHEVTLTAPFYLDVYEVTQEEYRKVMGRNPSHFCA